ncbi:hypothetical protein BGZ49_006133 [Haplosporangium sp. Z 27]|nr:hypothetical protein BGZ49_006133 [Haplosporangium sp. Z 27]
MRSVKRFMSIRGNRHGNDTPDPQNPQTFNQVIDSILNTQVSIVSEAPPIENQVDDDGDDVVVIVDNDDGDVIIVDDNDDHDHDAIVVPAGLPSMLFQEPDDTNVYEFSHIHVGDGGGGGDGINMGEQQKEDHWHSDIDDNIPVKKHCGGATHSSTQRDSTPRE